MTSKRLHDLYHSFRESVIGADEPDEAAEKWLDEHPEALCCGCDDTHHMSSLIVLIPHEGESGINVSLDGFMGTTVCVLPQNQHPAPVLEFFLYPGHLDSLVEALLELQKRQNANPNGYQRIVEAALKAE